MIKHILTITILAIAIFCKAQTTKTKYYKDEFLEKEVTEEKAKFSQTVIEHENLVTTETKNLKSNRIIRSQTYKGKEPYGIWKHERSSGIEELDYSFDLIYSYNKCTDTLSGIKNYLINNDSLKYKAPTISTGENSIYQYIAKNIVYPQVAKEEGIMGTVYLTFNINTEGMVENVTIQRGSNICLDKEAARVVKLLKFSSGPKLDGINKKVCMTMPIKFTLR
jgi:TonB family protein